MSVKLVVFNNGLQIIGKFVGKDEELKTVAISKPVQLVMMPNQNADAKPGQVGMAFAPFLQYTEEWESGVSFSVGDILTVAAPLRELENSYNTSFGSGLLLPPGVVGA
jgi:hypothetical protein